MGLNTMGSRIVVSDIQESFHFVKYKARENHLVIFADDVNPRSLLICLFNFCTVEVIATTAVEFAVKKVSKSSKRGELVNTKRN